MTAEQTWKQNAKTLAKTAQSQSNKAVVGEGEAAPQVSLGETIHVDKKSKRDRRQQR